MSLVAERAGDGPCTGVVETAGLNGAPAGRPYEAEAASRVRRRCAAPLQSAERLHNGES